MRGHEFTEVELIGILESALNKTLGEVDVKNVFQKTIDKPKITGIAGDVIEQSVLGYPADSYQHPDLFVDGVDVELKTTGIRVTKKKPYRYEAKEPMSITAVSPETIVEEMFYSSKFWHKLEHMLLVYYHYDSKTTVPAAEYANFFIRGYEFHDFSEEDESRLRADWEIVRDFLNDIQENYEVPEEQYPRLSSELRSKLMYIDTAPKWPNRPRFRLKRQLVTSMVQAHFGDRLEQLPGKYSSFSDIDYKCWELRNLYSGQTIDELMAYFGMTGKATKSISEQIIVRMFDGKSKKISKIELFRKVGLIPKTITLTKSEFRTEDMKLFPIDFDEWLDDEMVFEESSAYDYFANHQLMCIIFHEESMASSLETNRFIGFKRMAFSDDFIMGEVRKTWEEIRCLVRDGRLVEVTIYDKQGKPVINKNGMIRTTVNFPKSKDNIVFVRGSGKDSSDKSLEINGIKMLRQDFWIKGSYIAEELMSIPLI